MDAFFIYCSTGCTCCSDQNHYCGPYSTKEIAEKRVLHFRETRRLASQYSKNGNYSISKSEAEVLPDGRLIIDDMVYHGFVNDEAGNIITDEQDHHSRY